MILFKKIHKNILKMKSTIAQKKEFVIPKPFLVPAVLISVLLFINSYYASTSGKEGTMSDQLTEQEGHFLLSVARETIEKRLFNHSTQGKEEPVQSSKFSKKRGTFVTLTLNKNLRGCIGHIVPQETLLEGIQVNAINAAFRDPRFPPLSKKEWENIKIEISVLTDPKPLSYSDADDLLNKLRPGVDGVIIKKGYYQSTFLPQVWEQLPDKKEFLMHLCLKAGLAGDAWKNEKLEVSTYQVQAFEEEESMNNDQ
jgi:AmmeMemoRadiSam system protein A